MKKYSRHFASIALAGGLLLLSHERVTGYSYFVDDVAAVIWPTGQSIRYLSPTTFPEGSVAELHILEAMGLWNIIPDTDFEYSFIRNDQDFVIDHFDGFNDTIAVPADSLDPGVLGVTFLVNQGDNWFDMDVLFSDNPLGIGYNLDPNPDCDSVQNPEPVNGFSFLLVAVHELGHALGLGHAPVGDEPAGTPWFVATMNPRYPSGGPIGQENIIEVHTDDRNGLRFLYPPAGSETLIDLASSGYAMGTQIGAATPVTFEPTVAQPGDEISAQSLLENLGTTNELSVRQGFYLSNDGVIDVADRFLGSLQWDMAFQDAFSFDVGIDVPDVPAGTYSLGSIIDDNDLIPEEFEDNNATVYCEPLTIVQKAPVIDPISQEVVPCDSTYVGPTPAVTFPINMAPLTWALDNPPPGMTIDSFSGVISWPEPIPSTFAYSLTVRATNDAGTSTTTLSLGVERSEPVVEPMANQVAACGSTFVGQIPSLALADCMEPIFNWSLDEGPAGMTIHGGTGVVTWLEPLPSPIAYEVTIRATNAVGSGGDSWNLTVAVGDFDGNATIGIGDLAGLAGCLTGPDVAPLGACVCSDINQDQATDLRDYAAFQLSFQE